MSDLTITSTINGHDRIPAVPDEVYGAEDWFDEITEAVMAGEYYAAVGRMQDIGRKDLIGDQIAETFESHGRTTPEDDLEQLQLEYQTAIWVYACTFAIASNLSKIPLVAVRCEGKKKIDDPDSSLQELLDNPNISQGLTTDELVGRIATYLVLTGSAPVFMQRRGKKDARDPRGEIEELRVLRPSRCEIVPGDPWIQEWYHGVQGKEMRIAAENVAFPKLFDPNNDYWGLSPLKVLSRSISIDREMEEFNEKSLQNGGAPDVVLTTTADLTRSVRRRINRDWRQRFRSGETGGVAVMDRGLTATPLGRTAKDMEYAELGRSTKSRILATFGCPPIVVMDLRDASVLANAREQRQLFTEQTLMPHGTKIVNALTRGVQTDPRFERNKNIRWGVRFGWEMDKTQAPTSDMRTAIREDYRAGLLTMDEAREGLGRPPVGPEKGGDEFFTQSPLGFGAPVSLSMDDGSPRIKVRVASTEEYKRLSYAAFNSLRRRHEGKVLSTIRTYFGDLVDRTSERIDAHYNLTEKGVVPVEKIFGDFVDESLLSILFPVTDEEKALREAIGPVFLDAMVDAGVQKADSLFPGTTVDAINTETGRIREAYDSFIGKKISDISVSSQNAIRQVLAQGFEDGLTPLEIKNRVLDTMISWGVAGHEDVPGDTAVSRSIRIARTETATALNTGGFASARHLEDLGAQLFKSWLSRRDGNVRKMHEELDRSTSTAPIPLGQPFANGLMHPHDPTGDASEVVHCRCSLVESVAKEI